MELMYMYFSNITFSRSSASESEDVIGHVSFTVDLRSHLSKVPVRRSLDGTPYLDLATSPAPAFLRPVRAHARRRFELQLFAELRKRGITLEPKGDRSLHSPAKSERCHPAHQARPEPPETAAFERQSEVSP